MVEFVNCQPLKFWHRKRWLLHGRDDENEDHVQKGRYPVLQDSHIVLAVSDQGAFLMKFKNLIR